MAAVPLLKVDFLYCSSLRRYRPEQTVIRGKTKFVLYELRLGISTFPVIS
jgi:hypothetical protein